MQFCYFCIIASSENELHALCHVFPPIGRSTYALSHKSSFKIILSKYIVVLLDVLLLEFISVLGTKGREMW